MTRQGCDRLVRLASNENPLGPSRKAVEAARRALPGAHRYPDHERTALRVALAHRHGLDERQVFLGAGATEIIDLLIQLASAPGEEVLVPARSFAFYRQSAEWHRRAVREARNAPRFAYDVDAIVAAATPRTALVFLANPANPTGVYASKRELLHLLEALPPRVWLVVDEAYFEYARTADYPNAFDFLPRRDRLVVVRTFSKIHGLAGLRVGYAVAPVHLIESLERRRLPHGLSGPGLAAARAALADWEHIERSKRLNAEQLPRLQAGLCALGLEVLPSQGNFLLAALPTDLPQSAESLSETLRQGGARVRPLGAYGLPRHLRITVGTAGENKRLLALMQAAVEGQAMAAGRRRVV
jgi:histidinol-phosphate aminotransferase